MVERPKNVILMIADGFGPASATLAREFSGAPLALDPILRGAVITPSTSHRVTDSAASGTAYASGIRTYNGAIGVDSLRRPVGTVLEAAQARGMKTGLVATSRITHATPATFAAHVPARWNETTIAEHIAARDIDVVFGGGRKFFVPEAEGGARTDGRNLLDEVRTRGTAVVTDRAGFDGTVETPVLGLFSNEHLDYEIDRDEAEQPSLAAMTQRALDLLDGEAGFFLMVEGSRIDHAGHGNDPAGHVHDALAYDAAVRVALDFAEEDGRTLVISVADHETGGLSLGRDGIYAWHPEVLARVRATTGRMMDRIDAGAAPDAVLRDLAGIDSLTTEEQAIVAADDLSDRDLGHLISKRAGLGWTTKGHTGVDVGLYAFGPGAEPFRGVLTNDAVGRLVAAALGLDLTPVTEELQVVEDFAPGE